MASVMQSSGRSLGNERKQRVLLLLLFLLLPLCLVLELLLLELPRVLGLLLERWLLLL